MKQFLLSMLTLSLLVSCQTNMQKEPAPEQKIEEDVSDGVFIHLTHGTEDPHCVAMALQMANIMAEDKDVTVYFDIKGIEVVLKETGNIDYSTFPGSLKLIEGLKEKGIILMACPGCLKAAGKAPEDLLHGIIVAEKEKFFNFTKGRILTLDY